MARVHAIVKPPNGRAWYSPDSTTWDSSNEQLSKDALKSYRDLGFEARIIGYPSGHKDLPNKYRNW